MNRLELHAELLDMLEGKKAYYQPPGKTKIEYPCIVYSLSEVYTRRASDGLHYSRPAYDVMYLDTSVNDEIANKVLERFKMASFVSYYCNDGIHHYKFRIFY